MTEVSNSEQEVVVVHAQSCLTLHNPIDFSSLCSSVHRIILARILEWVASFKGSSDSEIEPGAPAALALAGRFFTTGPPGKPLLKLNSLFCFFPENIFHLLSIFYHEVLFFLETQGWRQITIFKEKNTFIKFLQIIF